MQSTVLCLLLGANHLLSLLTHFSSAYILHILGVFEVLLAGGMWGAALLWRAWRAGGVIPNYTAMLI